MSQLLIEKIKAGRAVEVEAGGHLFTLRRPTNLEIKDLRDSRSMLDSQILRSFVTGWKQITEADLIPGGTPKEVAFDPDLFVVWVSDQPDIYEKLLDAIIDSYKNRQAELGRLLKKPEPG